MTTHAWGTLAVSEEHGIDIIKNHMELIPAMTKMISLAIDLLSQPMAQYVLSRQAIWATNSHTL